MKKPLIALSSLLLPVVLAGCRDQAQHASADAPWWESLSGGQPDAE